MKKVIIAWITAVITAGTCLAGAFTAGNLVVELVGNGATLSSAATPVQIQEFTPTGTGQSPAQSIAMPQGATLPTGNPYNLLESGSATSAGFINRSVDGTTLCIPGYNGTNGEPGIVASSEKRVIGTLTAGSALDTSRGLTMYSGNNLRGVASVDGTAFWCSGPDGTAPMGLVYYNGSTIATLNAGYNARAIRIVSNTLYFSSSSASKPAVGVHQLGTAGTLPTAAATYTAVLTSSTITSPYGFDINPAGTVAYVADDGAGAGGANASGVWRFDNSGSGWTNNYRLVTTKARGLVVDWTASPAVVYVTDAVTANSNKLLRIPDAGAGSTATTLATAPANYAFRGVAFAPQPLPAPVVTITNPAPGTLSVPNATATYDLSGTSSNTVGSLSWTNALTGAAGTTSAGASWTISGIALGVGTNEIAVTASNAAGATVSANVAIARNALTTVVNVDGAIYQPFGVGLSNGAAVYLESDPTNNSPLRATQRSLGYREVTYKAKMFSGLLFTPVASSTNGDVVTYDYTGQKTKKTYTVGYWKDKDLPVMVGPDGNAYITDGHHTTAGYLSPDNAQTGDVVPGTHRLVLGHVFTNFYTGTPVAVNDTWWSNRAAENNAMLYGPDGNQMVLAGEPNYTGLQPVLPSVTPMPVTPSTLGPNAMTHDHYRGLTWGLADGITLAATNTAGTKIKGYSKTNPDTGADINFVEFFWADYLRNRVVWDDTKSGHALGSGFGDANAISAPIAFFAAVANGTALARSQDYRDQFGRGILDYTNSALFSANTVRWATKSLANGSYPAVAGDTYNLYLLDDSTIAGDIAPSPVSVNRLHVDTAAGMIVSNRLLNVRDLFVNAGGTLVTSWKDTVVPNSTNVIPAGSGRLSLVGTNQFAGIVAISNGTLAVDGALTSGDFALASGATLECRVGPGFMPITVTGHASLNGQLRVNCAGLGAGTYRLLDYSGTLSTNGASVTLAGGGRFVATLDTATLGQVNLRLQTPAGSLLYIAGDFHQHTTYTDGSNPFATVMAKNDQFGLDWWANSEHGGKFNRNAAGPILASGYDTGAYAQFLDATGVTFLGDSAGTSGGHTNMWRWQSLRDLSFNDLLAARSLYPAKTIVQGVEWNVPGHEHCSVAIVTDEFGPAATNANAVAQFEYLWDGSDTDTSLGAKNTTNNHAKAVQAVAWMQANYPNTSWMVPAHPERRGVQAYPTNWIGTGSQGYSAGAFRDLNNAGPGVCFGFESMPGHQKAGGRGGYGTGASGGGTAGGCGYYAARVGGLWDALLGEGRGFWLFASSDFHTTVEDFWPGEYQKTYTRSANANDPQAIVNSLRSGNSFVVEGDLIDALDFTVNGAVMGSTVTNGGAAVTVSIRVHDPDGANNCPTNLPAGIDTPVLDHLDVIAGNFGAKIDPASPLYNADTNGSTRVVARFAAAGGATDANGIVTTAWTDLGGGWKQMSLTYNTQGRSTYFRLRGSNKGVGEAGQTDAAGNPLVDPQGNTALDAWADLWFYGNPVFVKAAAPNVDATLIRISQSTLQWSPMDGVSNFLVTITGPNGFSRSFTVPTNNLATDALPNGDFTWTVAALYGSNAGPSSASAFFSLAAPLQFVAVSNYLANAVLRLAGAGETPYQVQASDELAPVVWRNVGWAGADTNGFFQVLDADQSLHAHRFYRAVQTNVPAATIAVFSDPHYMATNLLVSDGVAFQTYLAQDRKLLAQSAAILDAVVAGVTNAHPDIVLIPGDMTKDGELVSHQGVTNVLQRLRDAGAKVFVCPGNHDVNNPHAMSFDGSNTTPVPTIQAADFAAIYTNFGYSAAIARDTNSLAYVAEPIPGLRILAMDSCHYERNTNGTPYVGGYYDAARLAWITNQLAVARDQGKFVLGMVHHGLMEHYVGQKSLFPDYVIDDYANLDAIFARYGMKLAMTGHYHAQDIVKTNAAYGTLFDIETGSTVTYPCPYRIMNLASNGLLTVHSYRVTSIDYNLGGQEFPTYAYTFLTNGLSGIAQYMLTHPPYSLDPGSAAFLAPAMVEAFASHYQGDEGSRPISPQTQGIMAYLLGQGDPLSLQMYGALYSLFHDPAPADNDVRLNLLNGLTLPMP